MKIFNIVFCLFLSFLFIHCATILKGSDERVDFTSDPTNAKVYINGFSIGHTPISQNLESKRIYQIEFEKPGYAKKNFMITNSLNAGYLLLDILFGIIPIIVDAGNGAWYELDRNSLNARLEIINPDLFEEVTQTKLMYTEYPERFEITLSNKTPTKIINDSIRVTFYSKPFNSSEIKFDGVIKLQNENFEEYDSNIFRVCEDQIFFIYIKSDLIYEVDVLNESSVLTLEFKRYKD